MRKVATSPVRPWVSLSFLALAFGCSGEIAGVAGPWDGPGTPGTPADEGVSVDPSAPSTGADAPPYVGEPGISSRFVRLNHRQWENTVRDVLRLSEPTGLSSAFVAEPLLSTFDTNGSVLKVSQDLSRDYQNAAEKLAEMVARDPARLAALAPDDGSDAMTRADKFVRSFGLRAFRRPLSEAEVTRALGLFARGKELVGSGDDFADGVELVMSYFFQSPHFLYRAELSDNVADGKIRLNSYEIASRLSYALTNSMPDDALFAAAATDALLDKALLRREAERLVQSRGARETVQNFHEQLLHMSEYDAVSKHDKDAFPSALSLDLRKEAVKFVEDVVFGQNVGLRELLTAPYTFANQRLATLYGVSLPDTGNPEEFVRIDLDPNERAGILTQVGFLAANAEGATPNIIMRGVHIARRVLCADLPPPPNNVPPLPELDPNSTNRERVEELTKEVPCSSCHATLINPIGFAFENLDGFGRYREVEPNGRLIDAKSSYVIDGETITFDGAVDFVTQVAESKQVHECYARNWVEYLYARSLDLSHKADRALVAYAGGLSRDALSVQDLLVELVSTEAFVTRALTSSP